MSCSIRHVCIFFQAIISGPPCFFFANVQCLSFHPYVRPSVPCLLSTEFPQITFHRFVNDTQFMLHLYSLSCLSTTVPVQKS